MNLPNVQSTVDEAIHNISFLDVPVGVYIVAPDGRLLACNESVRKMLDLPLQGPVNASLAEFYADPRRRTELLLKANAAAETGVQPEKQIIALRVQGRELFVEDYCRALRDPATQAITGYLGCLVDITVEHQAAERETALRGRIEELTFDIGRILHANTSTLLMAQQTLDGVAEALAQRPLKDLIATPVEEMDEQLLKDGEALANALQKLLEVVPPTRRAQVLSPSDWELLESRIAPLRNTRDLIPEMEMRVPALRGAAHQVILVGRGAKPGTLPREALREVLQAAQHLESTACLIDVLLSRMAIIQMDTTLRSLRDFITSDVRVHEPSKRLSVKALTDQTIAHMAEYAKSSRVDIARRDRDLDVMVDGIERDLVRAFSNLLHNAIKYSWRRDRSKSPWVTIRTYKQEGMACIEFENWGVPIAQEEIEQGLIFQIGYRGKWSKDRGRLGTGIGLTDAKRTAEAHHGDLHVASRPSNPGWVRADSPEFYNQPFITTVTFCLPEAPKQRGDAHG